MSQLSISTIRRNIGKFALAAGFTSIMLAGGILVAAQDLMSPLPYGQKLASTGNNVVSTYVFASDETCNAVLSVMNDSEDEPVFMTLTETTTNSLVASLALPATGATFRLPQGGYQYKLTVQHVGVDDPTMYWMQVEKDCTTLNAQSGQSMIALVGGNGGTQTVRVPVTNPNGQSFVLLPAGGNQGSSTTNGGSDTNGGTNGGGNNGGGNNGGGNNGGGNNGGGNNGGGNNGGGNNGGGNNGGGSSLINADLTIIIRNDLTGTLEDVLNIKLDAGLAINLPEGNHLIEIVNNTVGDVGLGLTLDGDVSLTDIQVDVAAKLNSNLIQVDADVDAALSDDGLSLNVNGATAVGGTSLLDVDATVGGTSSSGSSGNGSLINVDATVGGKNGSNGSGSLVDVNATVGGNGSTGSNSTGSLINVDATVGGTGSSNSGSIVDVNANVGGNTAPIVDVNANAGNGGVTVNANVGGNTAPIVDVNANVNINNSAPVVDVNATVGAPSAPIVDVNANVNTGSAPAVDVDANVGGNSAPIVDVNANASSGSTSATVSVANTPVVNVSTGSTGTNVNVGGIGVKLP